MKGIIDFVRGTDKYGAKPPDGFPCRFAVLTWFEHEGGMADPWSLFRHAIPRIAALAGADLVMVEYWERHRTGIIFRRFEETLVVEVAWEGLMHSSDAALQEQTFPTRFRFLCGDRPVLVAESEMWSMAGGPPPYDDSVTISFFSTADMHEEFRQIFTEETGKLDISWVQASETVMKIATLLPRSCTYGVGILLNIVALVVGLMVFRYPPGSYFAILPDRLLITFVLQIGFCLGLIVALVEGRGWHKLRNSLVAVGFCVTAYWLYKGMEMVALKTMGFID